MRATVASLVLSGLLVVSGPKVGSAQSQAPGASVPAAPRPGAGPSAGRGAAAPTTGTAVIRGRVVAADTGAPLIRVQLRVIGLRVPPGETAPIFLTDDQGRYEIKDLPAGRFTVSAAKSGYLTMLYGQKQPADTSGATTTAADAPLDVADGQSLERIDFSLPRGGVIVAHVTDDFGEPIANVSVQVQRYRFSNGARSLTSVSRGDTNDLGEVRLSNIAPGDYYVSASGSLLGRGGNLDASNSGRIYGPSYYPGTSSVKNAQTVSVNVGLEASVSFPLVPVRSSSVSGVVRTSEGSVPVGSTTIWFSSTINVFNTLAPDGSFSLSNLSPGEFRLNVSPGSGPSATQEWGRLRLNLTGENFTGLVVTTSKGTTLRGHMVFDTGTPPADLRPESLRVFTVAATSDSAASIGRPVPHQDWTFEIGGVIGAVMLRVTSAVGSAPNAWSLKAVRLDGKDVTDVPLDLNEPRETGDLEVLLTQRRTELIGSVLNSRGEPTSDYAAIVFPEDKEQWGSQSRFVAAARPDQQGGFRITGLPPGRYLAAAVESLAAGEERDPELLDRLSAGATRFTLAEAETKPISLRMVR